MTPELEEYTRRRLEAMVEITSSVTDFRDGLPSQPPTMTGTLIEIDNDVRTDDFDDEC